jgi:ornithine carbamoyltransferase
MRKRDILKLSDLDRGEIEDILALARKLKREQKKGVSRRPLAGKTLALVFEKPSLRTRASFETGVVQLGGHALFLGPHEINLGVRESPEDCARSLSRWVDLIVARTFSHATLSRIAAAASVSVINGLTDLFHPCQVLADCLTLLEHKGRIDGLRVAYIGDGNNMAHSWIEAASHFSFDLVLACPRGYEPDGDVLTGARQNGRVKVTSVVADAACGADVLYTDVWTSMGQEAEAETRRRDFKGYQINREALALAAKDALVMHCLPAHRGEEITDEVLEGSQSVVFDQAENRLHAQKALMAWLLGGGKKKTSNRRKK